MAGSHQGKILPMSRRAALGGMAALGAAFLCAPARSVAEMLDAGILGQNLLAEGKVVEAAAILEQAVLASPDDPWLWGLLGRARQAAGQPGRAAEAFRRALGLDPADSYSRLFLDFLEQQGLPKRERAAPPHLREYEVRAREELERAGGRLEVRRAGHGYAPRRIVLDPGHGGFDSGAVGPTGLQEKDVVLDLARRTAELLAAEHPELRVYLTRDADYFVSLVDRTTTANQYQADLFISLHANAHTRSGAHGVETYSCSAEASDEESRSLAEFENAAARARESGAAGEPELVDLEGLLFRYERGLYWREGREAAERLQEVLVVELGMVDRGAKMADFHVLRSARMPAVLLETGFVSNPEEERLLRGEEGRDRVARAVAKGVGRLLAPEAVA